MKHKLKLTVKEFSLAIILAVMGLLFSTRGFIKFLDSVPVVVNFIIYYIILYSALFVLSKLGLTIFGFKIHHPLQTFGLLLITFAFFITVDWESPYVNIVTHGSAENVSRVYFGAEDGVTWSFWEWVGVQSASFNRWLTYVVTPFFMALIGGYFVSKTKIGDAYG
jgi:hypothetical protein